MAGWAASYGVTATGCGSAACPTVDASWRPDAGATGLGDGALAVTVRGVHGHAGVAVATLRSPVFLAPGRPLDAAFTIAARSVVAASSASGVDSAITVRLVDAVSGARRTIVDGWPSPLAGDAWTDVRGNNLTSGALTPSGPYRFEVEVRFVLAADDAPDTTLLLDRPTLAVSTGAADAGFVSPSTFEAPAIATAGGASAASDASIDVDDLVDDAPLCDDPVTVLGAGAIGRRLSVSGVVDAELGETVKLVTPDGWALGQATTDENGEFDADVVTPRAAGPARFVLARTADGEESEVVRVQRRHVLRGVRAIGSKVVVEGTVARDWVGRRGRATLDLLVPEGGPCGDPQAVRVGQVSVDGESGKYRGTLPDSSAGYEEVRGAHVIGARLTRPDGAGARLRAASPLTSGPASDTQEPGP